MLAKLIRHLPALQSPAANGSSASAVQNLETAASVAQGSPSGAATRLHPQLTGKIAVITGAFAVARTDLEQRLRAVGVELRPSVSARVQLLIAGDLKSTKKIDAARALGVQVITEPELLKLLEEATPV